MAFQIARRFLGGGGNSVAPSIRYLGRTFTSAASESNLIRATLFPGDGIGPEIAESVKQRRRGERLLFYSLACAPLLMRD
ncbi:hypothetical protein P3L10_006448 [Capsicum annuum]